MGLDMYVYEVSKPLLENRVYTSDELDALGYIFCKAQNFLPKMAELLPYTTMVKVTNQHYNLE